jgi:hypothetical protein
MDARTALRQIIARALAQRDLQALQAAQPHDGSHKLQRYGHKHVKA